MVAKRYFERVGGASSIGALGFGHSSGITTATQWLLEYSEKRAVPDISDGNPTSLVVLDSFGTELAVSAAGSWSEITTKRSFQELTHDAGLGEGRIVLTGPDAFVDIDAEL